MIMGNVPQNEKITSILDYSVEQLMENQNVRIEVGNNHRRVPALQAGVGIADRTAS
jgi:hypothetical protein